MMLLLTVFCSENFCLTGPAGLPSTASTIMAPVSQIPKLRLGVSTAEENIPEETASDTASGLSSSTSSTGSGELPNSRHRRSEGFGDAEWRAVLAAFATTSQKTDEVGTGQS